MPGITTRQSRARIGLRLCAAILIAGVLSGLAGVALTFLLHLIERCAYGYGHGSFLTGVHATPWWRRVAATTGGGLLAGTGWWLLRRRRNVPSLNDLVHKPAASQRIGTVLADALLQVLIVGSGASIGREGAPRQSAAVLAATATRRLRLADIDQQALIAGAAGAGLSAVYNTPIAGAVFALEIILRTRRPRTIAITVGVSLTGTSILWLIHGTGPTYRLPPMTSGWAPVAVWSVIAIVPCLILGRAFTRLTHAARRHPTAATPRLILSLGATGIALGVAGWWAPELFGNGKAVIDAIADGNRSLALLTTLIVLKPVATAGYLRAGATGGLLTPSLATGAAMGAVVAIVLHNAGFPVDVPSFALIAAVGCLATTQKAPLFAAMFTFELAHPAVWELACFVITALGASYLNNKRALPRPSRRSQRNRPKKAHPKDGSYTES